MNAIKIFAAVLCVGMLWATGVGAQKWNRCGPSLLLHQSRGLHDLWRTGCQAYGGDATGYR
jgi:hypothetical protein